MGANLCDTLHALPYITILLGTRSYLTNAELIQNPEELFTLGCDKNF